QLYRLNKLSPTGKVFRQMLGNLTPPGSPVYGIPYPETLGYPERKDTAEKLTPSQINEAIYQEGLNLAGADSIDIGGGRELLVFNTSAASTHTVLTVTYQEWEWSLRRQAQMLDISVPQGILIRGRDSTVENPKVPS